MTTFAYTPNTPLAADDPADDQPNMLQNTQNTNLIIAEDHISFNKPNGGRHTIVHLSPQSAPAVPVIGSFGYLFSRTVDPGTPPIVGNEVLFYRGGGISGGLGGETQMTMGIIPSAADRGYSYLPGAIMIQWGRAAISSGGNPRGVVNFNTGGGIAFANDCFCVTATLRPTGTSQNSSNNTLSIDSVGKSGFQWVFNGTSGAYPEFFWIAIGN